MTTSRTVSKYRPLNLEQKMRRFPQQYKYLQQKLLNLVGTGRCIQVSTSPWMSLEDLIEFSYCTLYAELLPIHRIQFKSLKRRINLFSVRIVTRRKALIQQNQ